MEIHKVYRELMEDMMSYNITDLIAIAHDDYGIFYRGEDKAELAEMCTNIEIENMVK